MVPHCADCPFGGRACGNRGNPEGDLVLIGEAPGGQELSKGVPFIGPSGKLLDETLRETFGFDSHHESVFVTNALFCRPTKLANAAPPQIALQACRGRLLTEVQAAPRRLVLALGNSALRALSDAYKLGITKERGVVHELEGLVVLPTFHPAAILRARKDYAKFREDFAYAAEIYRTGAVRDPGTAAFTLATAQDAGRLVQDLLKEPLLALDIETTGLDPRRDQIISVGVTWAKNRARIFPASELEALRPLFTEYRGRLIWHNGKYDTSFLRQRGFPARVDGDTLLARYALHEVGPFGLKGLASAHLGQRDYRAELNEYLPKRGPKDFSLIPESVLHPYLATDCDNTWQLAQLLEAQIASDPLAAKLYHKLLIPASNFLVRVEARGMLVSPRRLAEVRAELQTQRNTQLAEIDEYVTQSELWDQELYKQETGAKTAPVRFSPGSPKQLGWVLYKQLRMRPPPGVPKNTEARTLQLLPQNRLIRLILALRSVVKLLGTYVDGVEKRLGPDGRIHSTYLLHGTTNGRLSSQDPNMQNMPRQGPIKSMFVAGPGNVFLQFDYSQIELRCLAALSRDPVMVEFFRQGKDLHSEVAASVFGPEFTKEQRVVAKHVNFGIAYGIGAAHLAELAHCELHEARAIIDGWKARFPRAWRYISYCRQAPARGIVLATAFGRRRHFELITAENRNAVENESSNFPISSTASDLNLVAALSVDAWCERRGALIENLVHDAIVIECPEQAAPEVARHVVATMEAIPPKVLGVDMPFTADVEIGPNLSQLTKLVLPRARAPTPVAVA